MASDDPLDPESRHLWDHVTRHVNKYTASMPNLSKQTSFTAFPPILNSESRKDKDTISLRKTPLLSLANQDNVTLHQVPLTRRQLRKSLPQMAIDLHGMTQAQAFSALVGFLERAQKKGLKQVLVITGKGKHVKDASIMSSESLPPVKGVLQQQVPLWLSQPPNCYRITGVKGASSQYGGAGALQVFLKTLKVSD